MFEPLREVRETKAFTAYVIRLSDSFRDDIEINNRRLLTKLRNRIESTHKYSILTEIETFDWKEFEAFQAISVIQNPFSNFYEKYEDLIFMHHFAELQILQDERFRSLLSLIERLAMHPISICNLIDFSVPAVFNYIALNVYINQVLDESSGERTNQSALEIFKKSQGWGLRTLEEIKQGE